jgi:hypothetical protein
LPRSFALHGPRETTPLPQIHSSASGASARKCEIVFNSVSNAVNRTQGCGRETFVTHYLNRDQESFNRSYSSFLVEVAASFETTMVHRWRHVKVLRLREATAQELIFSASALGV